MRAVLGVLLLTLTACTPASVGDAPSAASPSARPNASATPGELFQFQSKHIFQNFVVDGSRLVFSGGDSYDAMPNVYSADPRTGSEQLIAKALDPTSWISILASVNGSLVFTESPRRGPVVYRIHAVTHGVDIVVSERTLADPEAQLRWRGTITIPMVTTDGHDVVWTAGDWVAGHREYRLFASSFDGSQRRTLYSSAEWIGYPHLYGRAVLFTKSLGAPEIWRVDLDGTRPELFVAGFAEATWYDSTVVAKKANGDAFAPGGLTVFPDATRQVEIARLTELAYEPSINERYVTWWGPTREVVAYDWHAGVRRILGQPLKGADGQTGIVGRQAAYPGAIVWIATPPGDLHDTVNLKPYFEVLFLH